jgi:hypothetical protein
VPPQKINEDEFWRPRSGRAAGQVPARVLKCECRDAGNLALACSGGHSPTRELLGQVAIENS